MLCDTTVATEAVVKSVQHRTVTESQNTGRHTSEPFEIATPIQTPLHESTDSTFEELRNQTELEVEALSPSCTVEFKCSLILERALSEQMSPTGAKKKRPGKLKHIKTDSTMSACEDEGSDYVCSLEFEWIHSDDRDQLHQVVQYIRNKIEELKNF